MKYSPEIDWITAWYGSYAAWDESINFWLTATFAVIVAVHALGDRVIPLLCRIIAFLYLAFSFYTGSRIVSLALEGAYIMEQMEKIGVELKADYFGSIGFYGDLVLYGLFFFGTLATVVFVLTAPRRST